MKRMAASIACGELQMQLIRFGIVGALNTAFSYAVYSAGIYLGLTYYVASLIALILGIVMSFVTQGKLVFKTELHGRFYKFLAVWTVLYFVNIGVIWLLAKLGFNYYLGGLLALVPVVCLSFVLQKKLVFQR